MRSFILVLLSLGLSLAACSKKGGGSVATPPTDDGSGGSNNGSSYEYDLSADEIYGDEVSSGWVLIDPSNETNNRLAYSDFVESAIYHQVYNNSDYGDGSYNYATIPSCNLNYLDDLYDYDHTLNFTNCTQYYNFIDSVSLDTNPHDQLFYLDIEQTANDEVRGTIAITYWVSGNTYQTKVSIPFRGTITEHSAGGGNYYHAIEVGGLTFYTANSNVTNPNNRFIGVDFLNDELGTVQFQVVP